MAVETEDRPGQYAPVGTARFYDAYGEFEWLRLEARAYGRLQSIIHGDFLRKHVASGHRVLDAGCGPGRFTIELAELGARPVALDTSPRQLKAAADRCRTAGVGDQVEAFLQGDIVNPSGFADESFDVVLCFGGPLSYVCNKLHQAAAELGAGDPTRRRVARERHEPLRCDVQPRSARNARYPSRSRGGQAVVRPRPGRAVGLSISSPR